MKETNKPDFYTLEQLDLLIELPVSEVQELLTPSIKFKGLLLDEKKQPFYADGIFTISESKLTGTHLNAAELEMMNDGVEFDVETWDELISVVGVNESNNKKLLGNKYLVKSKFQIDNILYGYNEFIEVTIKIGIPLICTKEEINKKKFLYNVQQVNKKSNFTVEEASLIASNWYISSHTGPIPQRTFENTQLQKYYSDILCECIKGQNQQGFHLITKELWVKSVDECYEEYSRQYPNGTQLVITSRIDMSLTTISKNELIRWCEFMAIETGLTIDDKVKNESIEFLKLEVERLNKRIFQLTPPPPRQMPAPPKQAQPSLKKVEIKIDYPPELQLAIDAYNEFFLEQKENLTNGVIKAWLQDESKNRGITHKDGAKELKGLSDIKLKTIPSIIKP